MAQDLKQYLAEHEPGEFKPVPHYFAAGDFATYYRLDVRCYAERVDDLLTIYRSCDNHEMVGCKIKGVKNVLRSAGDFGITIDDDDVKLGLFFFVGAAWAKDEAQRKRYDEMKLFARDVRLSRRDLPCGA